MKIMFIDNGTTGTIGVYGKDGISWSQFIETPIRVEQNYTKAKQNISRIDVVALANFVRGVIMDSSGEGGVLAYMERPLTTSGPTARGFHQIESGMRAFEATLVVLEMLGVPVRFCDSKDWQRGILPSATKRDVEKGVTKKESMDVGLKLFPQFKELITKHKDADGILGAYQLWKKENIHE